MISKLNISKMTILREKKYRLISLKMDESVQGLTKLFKDCIVSLYSVNDDIQVLSVKF